MSIPQGAQVSEDGNYWWDGSQWQAVDETLASYGPESTEGPQATVNSGSGLEYTGDHTGEAWDGDSGGGSEPAAPGGHGDELGEVGRFVVLHVAEHVVSHPLHISSGVVTVTVTLVELTWEGIEEAEEHHKAMQEQYLERITAAARAGLTPVQYVAGCDGDHDGTSWSGPLPRHRRGGHRRHAAAHSRVARPHRRHRRRTG
jgi:hypothetical protein